VADRTSSRDPGTGRTRLLDTAEELLDQHGIDGVSMRTVTTAAGHKNASAVNYHFGNRVELIHAVLDRRHEQIEARRATLLDELERDGTPTPRAAIEAAILPMVERLGDAPGRRYIRLLFQAAVHPEFSDRSPLTYSPTLARTLVHVRPLVAHLPGDRAETRLRIATGMALQAIADRARRLDAPDGSTPPLDDTTFTDDLLDAIAAALAA
jgi:AcrR family transcriptional regulator